MPFGDFGRSLCEALHARAPTSTMAAFRSVIRLAPPGRAWPLVATQHFEDTGGRRAVVSTRVGARRGTAMLFDRV
jgi:hypothetical protein